MTRDFTTIREKGINALTKELGSSGMAVFMSQFENGNGNYTEEREELLKNLTIDDIVASIKKRKNSNAI